MEASSREGIVEWSHHGFDRVPPSLQSYGPHLRQLCLTHNNLTALPEWFSQLVNLEHLDLSNNHFQFLPAEILRLPNLKTLLMRNNALDGSSLPKNGWETLRRSLRTLNLSGNRFEDFPAPICRLEKLTQLYLGGNRLRRLPRCIGDLKYLQILYLGGNRLMDIPNEVGFLPNLIGLVLSDNRIESLPDSLGYLSNLRSLSLHGNRLQILPPAIIQLNNLEEMSLRNNPLVVRFIRDMNWKVPSLQELCGRVIRLTRIDYSAGLLPRTMVEYLNSAHECVNPKCKGVYFTSRVDHVKFVDFCGKYRVPLQQYLCSPSCSSPSDIRSSASESSDFEETDNRIIQRVLLG